MKKKRYWFLAALILLILCSYFYLDHYWKPQLIKINSSVKIDEDTLFFHNYFNSNPFRNDQMWIKTRKLGFHSFRQFLFDLKTEKIIYEAKNLEVLTTSQTFNSTLGTSIGSLRLLLQTQVKMLLKIREPQSKDMFFNMDLFFHQNGSSKFLHSFPTIIEKCYVSPDERYARINVLMGKQYLVDFKEQTINDLPECAMWESGWLSNHEFIYRDPNWNVCVYDVNKRDYEIILTQPQFKSFLDKHNLLIDNMNLFTVRVVPTENGDRLLINGNQNMNWDNNNALNPNEAWVVELDRESRELQLLHKHFPFKSSGKWNADLTKYVYSGEQNKLDSSAVYLYDVTTEEHSMLVEDDNPDGEYSSPNFYGNKIIYIHHNALWIMNDNGSGKRQLFPPVH